MTHSIPLDSSENPSAENGVPDSKTDTLPAFYRHLPSALPEAEPFTHAVIEGDRHEAQSIVDRTMDAGASPLDINVGIVQPALYEVGQLWQLNRITVAQEHLATALCQNLLARIFTRAEMAELKDQRALFACVQGNHHSLGIRMISDVFELEGWEVQYLGSDTPTAVILTHIRQWQPHLLGLSLALPPHISEAKKIIDHCHGELGDRRPKILVGGLAVNACEDLSESLGADLWCPDARSAQHIAS